MKQPFTKISLIIIITGLFSSCNVLKNVAKDDYLLTDASVYVNDKKNNTETITNLLYQKPNGKIAGIPLRLHIYNVARKNSDSILDAALQTKLQNNSFSKKLLSKKQLIQWYKYKKGVHNWWRKTGEAPVIVDTIRTRKTATRLDSYYWNNGWFDVKTDYNINYNDNQRAQIQYNVETGKPYIIDSISTKIASPVIDSLYQKIKKKSLIQPIDQYRTVNFQNERDRITTELRNLGAYHFTQDYVFFEADTIGKDKKVNVELRIPDRNIRMEGDSTRQEPFKIYTIKDVNILTDYSYENRNKIIKDSTTYDGYNLYSVDGMKYRPKALTNAVFIHPGDIFRDIDRTRTYRYLSELQTFKYPNIEYVENPEDTTLTANIFLTPRKKFNANFSFDVTQSNIQTVGFSFSTSVLARNIFKGAETLELSAIGSIGASKDPSDSKDQFFDINELGANLRLTIPRLFFPFNTEKIIPKYMSPTTRITLGATSQTNIGLDKQTLSGVFNYRWYPNSSITNRTDLFNVEFVKNLNTDNYFEVYQNSYSTLNSIAQNIGYINEDENLSIPTGADNFLSDVLDGTPPNDITTSQIQTVNNINERKDRLTEDNLIFASNFSFTKDKRENLFDNDFSIFRAKLELAGNVLTAISKVAGQKRNDDDKFEVFGVAFSQYVKTELDYVKHWGLGGKNVLATRAFFGFAIPFGNSTNIPFARSFFAGGTNDNRAWTAYNLGPGTTSSTNEFNEANLKLAFSIEQRFNLFGNFNGAVFIDAGNIWNALDDVEDENAVFKDFSSLGDLAIGSGFGLRYDFSFFVLRFDIGFKTHDPSYLDANRWFNDYNFKNAVYNIGINYPF